MYGNYSGHMVASGGGATHIASTTNRGVLANYDLYRDEVLIVAGGGGGARDQSNNDNPNARFGKGGDGGGLSSGGAYSNYNTLTSTHQTVCIANQIDGYQFGQGGRAVANSGGGGGYMGGYSGAASANNEGTCMYNLGSGDGGSGYIGNLTSAGSDIGVRTGNGYARITWLGN